MTCIIELCTGLFLLRFSPRGSLTTTNRDEAKRYSESSASRVVKKCRARLYKSAKAVEVER